MRAVAAAVAIAAAALATTPPAAAATPPLFFDDFSHADMQALRGAGWTLRDAPGHPGVPGARWSPQGVRLVDDPARPGNRLMRLEAATDGTPAGTEQAQVCHRRRLLHGTWAARVRLSDRPLSGVDGDPVVQAFYAISPLLHDLDPGFSEVDFEYLPNGGWGSAATRLYAISWQTVRLAPWQAFNAAHEEPGSHDGWRVLLMQADAVRTRHAVDGRWISRHGGRHVPVRTMSLNFSLWFSTGGLLPAAAGTRRWAIEVDWVMHVPGRALDTAAVLAEVGRLRARGQALVDTVPAPDPPAEERCDL